jgi:hypothetical protein
MPAGDAAVAASLQHREARHQAGLLENAQLVEALLQ